MQKRTLTSWKSKQTGKYKAQSPPATSDSGTVAPVIGDTPANSEPPHNRSNYPRCPISVNHSRRRLLIAIALRLGHRPHLVA